MEQNKNKQRDIDSLLNFYLKKNSTWGKNKTLKFPSKKKMKTKTKFIHRG